MVRLPKNPKSNIATRSKGKSYTERGFRVYGEVQDSYGSTVIVQESSSAERVAAWIFCHKHPELGNPDAEMSPHLTVGQAKRVIKYLQKFVDENSGK